MPRVSLLVVSYDSGADLPQLVTSFRREAEREGLEVEVVVVDHSEGTERPRFDGIDRWIAQPNRGYAAGVNRAAVEASGEILMAANPDVRFLDGSLRPLVSALDEGWEIVGPRFELDGFVFPPSDPQTPAAEIGRRLSSLHPLLYRSWLVRRLRDAVRVWDAESPVPQRFLSGALLALRAATYRRLGPWPEEYFLYFEETEWLLRAARGDLRAAQVPGSRVEHRWGGSTGPNVEDRYEASRRRYFRRNFGVLGALAVTLRKEPSALEVDESDPVVDREGKTWWLAAPSPSGWPAARWSPVARRDPVDAARRLAASLGAVGDLTLWSWDPESKRVGSVRTVRACEPDGVAE